MFWKYNSLNVSNIDTLLEKQEVTLSEILQQEDIIQECKSQNKKLVEFLTKQEVLSELLDLILKEPPTDIEEKLRYHLPNIASELITCDVPQINEKLSSDVSLLDKMYSFLDNEPPLNPLLTSFFSKAFGVLITRRSDQNWYSYQLTCLQVIEYIKTKPSFTSLLLKHMGTSAVMDLLLRLITCVEGTEMRQNILGWLNSERLIERVIGLLGPCDGGGEAGGGGDPRDPNLQDKHDNAGQLLVEIVRVSRDSQLNAPTAERFLNPLLHTAESPETVELLLGNMFDGQPRESIIINSVNVLMSLLEIRRPGPTNAGYYPYTTDQETGNSNEADIARQQAVLEKTVETILPRLGALSNVLQNPPVKASFRTTAGLLDPPLGATRLALAKLTATVLSTHHPPTNHALAQTNVLDVLLDLFFKYSLNNFLHSQVESSIKHILFWKFPELPSKSEDIDSEVTDSIQTPKIGNESENPLIKQPIENPLIVHLFSVSRLVERVVDAFEDNDETSTTSGRKAYMGHLTGIANAIVMAGSVGEDGGPCPSDSRDILLQEMSKLPESTSEKWNKLVSGTLLQLNKLNEIKPTHEDKRNSSSDDEDADFRDINFPQDTALQQMQQMSDNFIDSFGFNDEEFTEADENVGGGMRKLTSVNFLMATDESNKQQQLFEAACDQRIKPFRSSPPPGDDEEDPWAERTAEISFGAGVGVSVGGGVASAAQDDKDTDSEEEDEVSSAPARMEVDSEQDPWESIDNAPVAMDTASPWGEPAVAPPVESQEEGWADFRGFSSAGGEGFASFAAFQDKQESMEENGDKKDSDDWSPAMVSSPEATTLDDPVPDTPPSPSAPPSQPEGDVETPMAVQDEKYAVQRPESPDISDSNANPAPVPSDIVDRGEEEEAKATDNFSFLASRGLLSNQDNLQLPAKPESEPSIQAAVEASGPA